MPVGEIDEVAWKFLRSEFTGRTYANWPIDRRVDAYLIRNGLRRFLDNGADYSALLDRVMSNIGAALRSGILSPGC